MRLIDADKLIEEGWILERHGISNRLLSVKSIADVRTAYDLEKVVAELEEAEKDASYEWNRMDDEQAFGAMVAYSHAIEIVRQGSV